MLTDLCHELKNWFVKSDDDKHIGTFKIRNGVIAPFIDLKESQYYRIVGSLYNDGVHKFGHETLTDEDFDGSIWLMYVPKEVLELSEDIDKYIVEFENNSPFTSESFGGYSYSKATNDSGITVTWKNVFADRLNRWRKIV